jgi:hypothetical protein
VGKLGRIGVLVVSGLVAACVAAPAWAGSVAIGGTIGSADPTFTHLANHSCTTSSGQTTHYDAIQFWTVGTSATTISVSVTPVEFTGAVFLYQGGFLPGSPIVNCYDTASSVVGTVSGGTLTFATNFGALPSPFTQQPWTLVVTTDTAASPGGSYSATIGSSATGVALPSTTSITGVTPEPSDVGEPVVVQYDVSNLFGGTPAPSGTVTVIASDGSESCSGSVAAGQCTIVLTAAGDRTLTASYSGDGVYQSSVDFADHTVKAAAATTVSSITRADPSPTKAATIHYTVTFADAVTGLSTSAFTLVSGGGVTGASVTAVSGGGTTWTVTAATGTGSGTLRLDLTSASGIDPTLGNLPFAGAVYVIDKTPPVVSVPANQVVEATGPTGAAVTYPAATAVDTVDGPLTASCTPPSGSTFPLGTTTVTCSATDTAGNSGTASFTVKVEDTTPPSVSVPANQVVEATGPTGAIVTYPAAAAVDAVDGPLTASCAPPSGATFPLGMTTVTCSATDAHGNTGTASFIVKVQDTTAPVYGSAPNVTVNATSPAGAVVSFPTPPATDAVGVTSNVCAPPSGTTFPVGTTTVTCHATDAAGNLATTTFTVTVLSGAAQIANLLQQIESITPPPKFGGSLPNKLNSALASLQAGHTAGACGTLQGFINEVKAQSGKKLSTADATLLIAAATQIRAALGC